MSNTCRCVKPQNSAVCPTITFDVNEHPTYPCCQEIGTANFPHSFQCRPCLGSFWAPCTFSWRGSPQGHPKSLSRRQESLVQLNGWAGNGSRGEASPPLPPVLHAVVRHCTVTCILPTPPRAQETGAQETLAKICWGSWFSWWSGKEETVGAQETLAQLAGADAHPGWPTWNTCCGSLITGTTTKTVLWSGVPFFAEIVCTGNTCTIPGCLAVKWPTWNSGCTGNTYRIAAWNPGVSGEVGCFLCTGGG